MNGQALPVDERIAALEAARAEARTALPAAEESYHVTRDRLAAARAERVALCRQVSDAQRQASGHGWMDGRTFRTDHAGQEEDARVLGLAWQQLHRFDTDILQRVLRAYNAANAERSRLQGTIRACESQIASIEHAEERQRRKDDSGNEDAPGLFAGIKARLGLA